MSDGAYIDYCYITARRPPRVVANDTAAHISLHQDGPAALSRKTVESRENGCAESSSAARLSYF
jgi:hypothetical protein